MPLLADPELKAATAQYLAQVTRRGGLPGIFDKWFLRVARQLAMFDPVPPWEESVQRDAPALAWDFARLRQFLSRWRQGRFVSYAQREATGADYLPGYGTEFGIDVLLTCQGTGETLQWRGLPLMKTVFDFALYPQLIAELRPASIFEIGSGSGASALWFADLMRLNEIAGTVHSVDIRAVKQAAPGVTFYQGDCSEPESLFPAEALRSAPHPWLVVEDAHHNVKSVLAHFHHHLASGDYLVVEDSEIKRDDIRQFLAPHPDAYRVDARYTDFFGRNATCALDSIFRRVA
jgi:cephalosporin hydroxylase